MITNLSEISAIIIVTIALGYIFSGYIRYPVTHPFTRRQLWEDFKFSMMISAPAVILHELGHKFMAMSFGYPSFFHVFWLGLALAVILRLVQSPFLIIAPGYVLVPPGTPALPMAAIAFAGPLVNLILWLGSRYYLKRNQHRLKRRTFIALLLTEKINMMLFLFNMIPIPPLDGYSVLTGIIELAKTAF